MGELDDGLRAAMTRQHLERGQHPQHARHLEVERVFGVESLQRRALLGRQRGPDDGVFAPHAALRPTVTLPAPAVAPPAAPKSQKKKRRTTRRLDWATLHQQTFGVDVLRCPCGGRRRIHAIYSTRKTAEERLLQLGHRLPARLLPPSIEQPSLPLAG